MVGDVLANGLAVFGTEHVTCDLQDLERLHGLQVLVEMVAAGHRNHIVSVFELDEAAFILFKILQGLLQELEPILFEGIWLDGVSVVFVKLQILEMDQLGEDGHEPVVVGFHVGGVDDGDLDGFEVGREGLDEFVDEVEVVVDLEVSQECLEGQLDHQLSVGELGGVIIFYESHVSQLSVEFDPEALIPLSCQFVQFQIVLFLKGAVPVDLHFVVHGGELAGTDFWVSSRSEFSIDEIETLGADVLPNGVVGVLESIKQLDGLDLQNS